MQPVKFSHVEARRGRPYWFRSGDDVCYYRNVYRNESGGGGNTHMTCTFTQVFPHEGDCCYLAYHYPYTYSKLIMDIETLISQADRRRIYVKRQTLCKTLSGNNVPVLTITNIPQHDDIEKVKHDINTMVVEIDSFFGVYLLNSVNPKYRGKTYIGFTVDPQNRIRQHNGEKKGGARKTERKRPWKMVLVVHGFPSEISALRFEWAWQNPETSTRLKMRKERGEKEHDFKIRVVSRMVNHPTWNRLPLTIRWQHREYEREFLPAPPLHMPIAYGEVKCTKNKVATEVVMESSVDDSKLESFNSNNNDEVDESSKENAEENSDDDEYVPLMKRLRKSLDKKSPEPKPQRKDKKVKCGVCGVKQHSAKGHLVRCPVDRCEAVSHVICLADRFLGSERGKYLIPVQGECPVCETSMMWGDVIRKNQGFNVT